MIATLYAPTAFLIPPTSSYPWASGEQHPHVLDVLLARCHTEQVLKTHSYAKKNPERETYRPLPAVSGWPKRRAIALDCEMVGLTEGRDALARLSAVDFMTGEVLIDQLVVPTEHVVDWRTRWSGVSRAKMQAAREAGEAIEGGWAAARTLLSTLADSDTVLVGHALHHDLRALRITHDRIVDSSIVYAEEVFGCGDASEDQSKKDQRPQRLYGLRRLCKEVLGIAVQAGGRTGHDGLEDALATRELTLRYLVWPAEVRAWASDARAVFEAQKLVREEKQRAKAEEKKAREKEAAAEREENSADTHADRYQPHPHAVHYQPYTGSNVHNAADIGFDRFYFSTSERPFNAWGYVPEY